MIGVTGGPACQSCGSPMMSDKDHGGGRANNPYCRVCTDGGGNLLGYEDVVRAMAEQRFMKVNGMPRRGAEDAARRALAQMPAWKGRAG
jgi:Putative zinc ribbon domain